MHSSIVFQDFLVTLSTLLRGSVYERLRWTFKLYDLNGDGCISRGELSEVVLAVHELMGRRPHQPEDDRKARDQVRLNFVAAIVHIVTFSIELNSRLTECSGSWT